jgi:Arc/MetJ family transcription regulator
MRTNIVIDDQLMAEVMATGRFKTKREAVEEGLRLLKRRQVYDGLLALRGKLHWDDSDEGWTEYRKSQLALKAAGLSHDADALAAPKERALPLPRVAVAAQVAPKPYRGRKKP